MSLQSHRSGHATTCQCLTTCQHLSWTLYLGHARGFVNSAPKSKSLEERGLPFYRLQHCNASCMLCRLFNHSQAGQPLVLLHEIDLCVVGIASLAFGGAHHASLAVGSVEATTHVINLNMAEDGYLEPPQVVIKTSCVYWALQQVQLKRHCRSLTAHGWFVGRSGTSHARMRCIFA